MQALQWIKTQGSAKQIGQFLGGKGKVAMHSIVMKSALWHQVNHEQYSALIENITNNIKARFPEIFQELLGLSEGLEIPIKQVIAWNSKGDILASIPEGCTTIAIPDKNPTIAHNEDGFPELNGHCFIAEISPLNAPSFISFYYPGSIPGHTFAATSAGIAQGVNNLRLHNVAPDIPRSVLGRATLACRDLDQATEMISERANCGGFHFTLAEAKTRTIQSIEFGAGLCVHKTVEQPMAHTNHALSLVKDQTITLSSHARMERACKMLHENQSPLDILRDQTVEKLPIHRTKADDPDEENTLATAIFQLDPTGISWKIYSQGSRFPEFQGFLDRI